MVTEERRFLGEVIAQKEKKGCPQLSTLEQLYEGELENLSMLANRTSKMIRDDVFSRAKCQVSRRKGSKSASQDTLSGLDQVCWISQINSRLCFLLYFGCPLIFT